MAIETTPLGFQKPDGNELLRNGDNVIAANAQKAEDLHKEHRGRLDQIEQNYTPLSRGVLANGTDLDTLTGPTHVGTYSLPSSSTYPNCPAGLSGTSVLEVQRGSGNALSVVHRVTAGTTLVWREAVDAAAGTWSDWSQAETKADSAPKFADLDARAPKNSVSDIAGIAYSVTDKDGGRSWIEIGMDGMPTPESAAMIVTATSAGLENALPLPKSIPDSSGVAYSITDKDGGRSWLEVALDGGPTQNALDLLGPKLNIQAVPTYAKPTYGTTQIKIASGPDVVLFGDSMTAQGWDVYLAPAIGRTVYKCGVGGETSSGIAARTNAMPYLMLPAGGAIPASGGVTVTLTSAGGGTPWPLLQGAGTPDGQMRGTLAGVPGVVTLTKPTVALPTHGADDYYTFTRDTAGTSVPVTRPMPFFYTNGEARRGDITVIWAGRNNFTEDNGDRAFRDIKAMTDYLNTLDKRFLVLAVHNGTGEGAGTVNYPLITGLNARLLAEYGRRFVDHRRYLVQYGLADAGITPTSQDTADVTADTVPASLRADSIHQNEAGKQITAKQVELRLKEMGWA